MKKKLKNKEKNKLIKKWRQRFKDIFKNKKEIFKWTLEIGTIIITLIGLGLEVRVKKDTEELTKLTEKPIYYTIRLYPTEKMYEYTETEKHLWLNLQLVVDDFEITNENMNNVNYNAIFTHKKYFMVYDYKLSENGNEYYYHIDKMDDKTEAKLRLEDEYYVTMVGANYSKTPNNKYIYILIYTETLSEQNLDLIFFDYTQSEKGIILNYETNENGDIEISTERIDKDVNICKEYFIEEWSNGEESKIRDLEFLFDVYNDLAKKVLD